MAQIQRLQPIVLGFTASGSVVVEACGRGDFLHRISGSRGRAEENTALKDQLAVSLLPLITFYIPKFLEPLLCNIAS